MTSLGMWRRMKRNTKQLDDETFRKCIVREMYGNKSP